MKLQSIRRQLPLSYAAIAFIATLCLGVVLLTILNSHYARLERETIEERANGISGYLTRAMAREELPENRIANQLASFAFLSDMRIQLNDSNGELIVDTGSPQGSFISMPIDYAPPPNSRREGNEPSTITIMRPNESVIIESFTPPLTFSEVIWGNELAPDWSENNWSEVIVDGIPYDFSENETISDDDVFFTTSPFGGFDFITSGEIIIETIPRSNQSITLDIHDGDNALIATLIIGEGPAFGQDIIASVGQGWLYSSIIAVLLAGVAGWMVSLRLTTPLTEMTAVTKRMTDGDLSARTDLKRKDELGVLASAFNEMATRIEDTVTALRQFVADAAHELNTPLTALRTNLELALESPSPEATQRALTQLSRLEILADDLLDLSRIEAKRNQLSNNTLSINEVIRETSITYASRAEQADIEFELELPDSEPLVQGNANQIQRLLSNLMDNAIKFTPEGGVVRVRAEIVDDGVTVIVEDTGIGIPESDLPHLFMRFHRGRNTNTYPGSGLGLAIVKAIVDAHRGHVHAESNRHGTRITTMLPIGR